MEQKEKLIVYSLCIDAVSPRYCQHTRRVEKKKGQTQGSFVCSGEQGGAKTRARKATKIYTYTLKEKEGGPSS